MLCDECKKNQASMHTINIINGVKIERHLCAECQQKQAYKTLKMSTLGDFFSNFSNFLSSPERDELVCPKCGTTGEDFLNTGYVGCSDCYKNFAPIIMPVIKRVQTDVKHVGKTPLNYSGGTEDEYERLSKEMKKAIEQENFEQATILRDRMRQLKGGN